MGLFVSCEGNEVLQNAAPDPIKLFRIDPSNLNPDPKSNSRPSPEEPFWLVLARILEILAENYPK